VDVDRSTTLDDLEQGAFDLVVFGSIWRQTETFQKFDRNGLFSLPDTTFAFLDGEDTPSDPQNSIRSVGDALERLFSSSDASSDAPTPPFSVSTPVFSPALQYGPYFKRELTASHAEKQDAQYPLFPISFSIPQEKVRTASPSKKTRYPRHVQCEEAYKIDAINQRSTPDSIFSDETRYYDDIASAKFGITQKKAGWECMRHYEIGANLTVPCFHRLSEKPFLTAPHGLQDFHNCLVFQTADELSSKIQYVEENGVYNYLVANSAQWTQEHTCQKVAARLLTQIGANSKNESVNHLFPEG
jgi:hypothetical protein